MKHRSSFKQLLNFEALSQHIVNLLTTFLSSRRNVILCGTSVMNIRFLISLYQNLALTVVYSYLVLLLSPVCQRLFSKIINISRSTPSFVLSQQYPEGSSFYIRIINNSISFSSHILILKGHRIYIGSDVLIVTNWFVQ